MTGAEARAAAWAVVDARLGGPLAAAVMPGGSSVAALVVELALSAEAHPRDDRGRAGSGG